MPYKEEVCVTGKLYEVKFPCSLFSDQSSFEELAMLQEGEVVMVVGSNTRNHLANHKVVYRDMVGWLDLGCKDLEPCDWSAL